MTTVRAEQAEDHAGIHALHVASFPTPSEARLVDALRKSERLSASVVALDAAGIVVGHAGFSPLTVESTASAVCLGPVAVLPGHRRRGIGEQVVRFGLGTCKRAGTGFVVVLGDPRYYRRFGFRPAADWQLRDEYDGGDAFQALELRVGAIPRGCILRHAPEFAALGV
jgi:putative acetyltransferase